MELNEHQQFLVSVGLWGLFGFGLGNVIGFLLFYQF
jgi:hypothetical protein